MPIWRRHTTLNENFEPLPTINLPSDGLAHMFDTFRPEAEQKGYGPNGTSSVIIDENRVTTNSITSNDQSLEVHPSTFIDPDHVNISSSSNYTISYPKNDWAIVDGRSKLDEEIEKIWERLNKTVTLVHNCANCGARLEVEENKPIIHCKYCGSTYLVGAVQPNSTY